MTVSTSNARHVLVRLGDSAARLPEALLDVLRDEVVTCGWVRGGGILVDAEIRSTDARGSGVVRKLTGHFHATVDGSVAVTDGDVACGLRVVLSREGDGGPETFAGELVSAKVAAFEGWVASFDDVTARRDALSSGGTIWTPTAVSAPSAPALPPPQASSPAIVAAPVVASPPVPPPPEAAPAAPAPPPVAAPPPAPSEPQLPTPAPATDAPRPAPKPAPGAFGASTIGSPAAIPARIAKPVKKEEEDVVYPDAGDTVEHFAFGRCEVLKSDGDRLHLRVGKDGRVKEIALEMLRVTPLPPAEGQTTKHFKLDRKL